MRKLYVGLLILNLVAEAWIGWILLVDPGTGEAM
jgi:hypothetical protein